MVGSSMNAQVDGWMDGLIDACGVGKWMDGWVNELTDGQEDARMKERVSGQGESNPSCWSPSCPCRERGGAFEGRHSTAQHGAARRSTAQHVATRPICDLSLSQVDHVMRVSGPRKTNRPCVTGLAISHSSCVFCHFAQDPAKRAGGGGAVSAVSATEAPQTSPSHTVATTPTRRVSLSQTTQMIYF